MTDLSLSYDFQNKNQDYKKARQKEFDILLEEFKNSPEKGLQFIIDIGGLNADGSYSKNYYPQGI